MEVIQEAEDESETKTHRNLLDIQNVRSNQWSYLTKALINNCGLQMETVNLYTETDLNVLFSAMVAIVVAL